MNKAIFLDRDGTINVDFKYTHKIEDLKFCDRAIEGLLGLQSLGFVLIIITNQSAIGRGFYTLEQAQKFNEEMLGKMREYGISIEKIYFCPHKPEDRCSCRKPAQDNIQKAQKEYNIDLKRSWFVGDRDSDILCGQKAGCKTARVRSDHPMKISADMVIDNLFDLYQAIKGG